MAGRPDVDAMLDGLSIAQVRRWRAYFDAVGTEAWRQAGTVAAEVGGLSAAITNAFGGKAKAPSMEDRIDPPLVRSDPQQNKTDDGGIADLEKALTEATRTKRW